jgi:hypothetical protein
MDTDSSFQDFLVSDDAFFHYTRTSTALERILADGKLRLSLLKDTNDPREYKFKLLNMMGWSLSDATQDLHRAAHPVFDRIVRMECRVACFCTNAAAIIALDDGNTATDPYSAKVGWNKPRMWSQYGENHRGICLVFSRSAIEELKTANQPGVWFESGDVRYMKTNGIPASAVTLDGNRLAKDGVEACCAHHIRTHYQALFLTKHVDYRDESEYRFIVADPSGAREHVDISTSLRAVIAGDRTPEVYFPLLEQLSYRYKATCRRAYWDRGKAHLLLLRAQEKAKNRA